MATPESTPTQTEPTPAQAVDIASAGAHAVRPGQTPEEMRAAVDEAVARRVSELQVKMSPEERSAMADEFIRRLEAMGAFQKPEPPVQENSEGEGEGELVAAEPPAKRTLAQKLLGDG